MRRSQWSLPTTERDVTGGSYPAEIFGLVMADIHEGLDARPFAASIPTTTTTQYPPVVEVPSVIDLPQGEATDVIEEAYLNVRVSEVVRPGVEPGTVVNQIPRATELASGGSAVIIEVAIEPPDPEPDGEDSGGEQPGGGTEADDGGSEPPGDEAPPPGPSDGAEGQGDGQPGAGETDGQEDGQ